MVIKKEKINVGGVMYEVPIFHTKLKPGDISTNTINDIEREEEIERKIQEIKDKIVKIKEKFQNIYKNLDYSYEVGKTLSFVDRKNYKIDKGGIWKRLARDLGPELFKIGPTKVEPERYAEFMYNIAKFPRTLLRKASWGQWYEIQKFKEFYKNRRLLSQILDSAHKEGLSRDKIKELIKSSKRSRR